MTAPFGTAFRIWRNREARAIYDWKRGPQPGFYSVRYVRLGPEIAAEIRHEPPRDPVTGEFLDRSWTWMLFVDGKRLWLRDDGPGSPLREAVAAVATWGTSISKALHDHLIADLAWVRRYGKKDDADPHRPIDLGSAPLVY
jgi:hypothetical protein